MKTRILAALAALSILLGATVAYASNTAHSNSTYYNQARAMERVVFCGQADEAGTVYLGPATAPLGGDGTDHSNGSVVCDALDSGTEATADAPIATDTPYEILGIFCKTDGTLAVVETVVVTMRSSAADTATVMSCTIGTGEVDCASTFGTRTTIVAGATVAIKAVQTGDNTDDNLWCTASIAWGTPDTPATKTPLP